jgi:hypothetical protein
MRVVGPYDELLQQSAVLFFQSLVFGVEPVNSR